MSGWIEPAGLCRKDDGTPYSPTYGDVYHAIEGGPGQAREVFLAGNDLPSRWRGRDRFVILETGFGTGLNFLATATAWREDPRRSGRLHYLSLEKHPFPAADLAELHSAWPEFALFAAELRQRWPILLPGLHRLEFDSGRLVLTLVLGDATQLLRRLSARVDAFYLDGFAPDRNPEMWSPELCRALARLAAPGATLATWSVAAAVRQALARNGFVLEKRPGYGRKRERLIGRFAPHPKAAPPAPPPPPERHALVIGAGLAGCAAVERLAARGWNVELIDARPTPAGAASGNLAGLYLPLVSLDDNLAARLSRTAFMHARRRWIDLAARGHPARWRDCGVLQVARDAEHEARQRGLIESVPWPAEFIRFISADAARQYTGGHRPAHGGWLFPLAGWAHPPSLCAAHLAAAGERLRQHFGRRVTRLERSGGMWRAVDEVGQEIAAAAVAILAPGAETGNLNPCAGLPIQRVRGQVSLIDATALTGLELGLCREGYATPELDGLCCIGASYALDADPEPRPGDDAGNLARLERLLPGRVTSAQDSLRGARVSFRAVAPDRLPLVGALPDPLALPGWRNTRLAHLPRIEGLHGLMGYASRGLIWADLMAELLASRLEGDPLPLETDLVEALDPGRFALKRIRRGGL